MQIIYAILIPVLISVLSISIVTFVFIQFRLVKWKRDVLDVIKLINDLPDKLVVHMFPKPKINHGPKMSFDICREPLESINTNNFLKLVFDKSQVLGLRLEKRLRFEEHRNKLLKELKKFRGNVRGPEDDGIPGYLNGKELRDGAEDMLTSAAEVSSTIQDITFRDIIYW